MSLSVRSKKKAEILDVILDVEFVLESVKKSKVFPIKIVVGDHEIVGDFIILKVSHLNSQTMAQTIHFWLFQSLCF